MYKEPRQTGRTTRMLSQAIEEARLGRSVAVICHSRAMIEVLSEKTHRMVTEGKIADIVYVHNKPALAEIKLGNHSLEKEYGKILFTSANCNIFRWENAFTNKPIEGIDIDDIHIDHAAIEQKHKRILDELHRYDEPNQTPEELEENSWHITRPQISHSNNEPTCSEERKKFVQVGG